MQMKEHMTMDLSEAHSKVFILEAKLKEQARVSRMWARLLDKHYDNICPLQNFEEMVSEEKQRLEEKLREQETKVCSDI